VISIEQFSTETEARVLEGGTWRVLSNHVSYSAAETSKTYFLRMCINQIAAPLAAAFSLTGVQLVWTPRGMWKLGFGPFWGKAFVLAFALRTGEANWSARLAHVKYLCTALPGRKLDT
jgi:hypothetical protein